MGYLQQHMEKYPLMQIEDKMSKLSTEEQFNVTVELRDNSIVDGGRTFQENTGYGILREIFCNILVEKLGSLAFDKINMEGEPANIIKADITEAILALPDDLFGILRAAIYNQNANPNNLGNVSEEAMNKRIIAMIELKNILDESTIMRQNQMYNQREE